MSIPNTYRRIVLARRPPGEPVESDFRLEEVPMPECGPKEVLVRNIYLSLDPYMRGRMRDVASYAPPVQIGEVMTGGTVGQVVASNHAGFKVGDYVEERLGWQEYGISQALACARSTRRGRRSRPPTRARHAGYDGLLRPARSGASPSPRDRRGLGRIGRRGADRRPDRQADGLSRPSGSLAAPRSAPS